MNKLAGIMVAILIGLGMMISPNAQEIIKLQTPPAVIDGTLMGPVKEIAAILGAECYYDAEAKATVVKKGQDIVVLFPGTNRAEIGIKEIKLAHKIEFDRTDTILVAPIRPIIEGLGGSILKMTEPDRKTKTAGEIQLADGMIIELPNLPTRMFLWFKGQKIYPFEGDYLVDSAHCCTGIGWKVGREKQKKKRYFDVYHIDYLDPAGSKSVCIDRDKKTGKIKNIYHTPYKIYLLPTFEGHHVRLHAFRYLPPGPASHGCWRLPYEFAKKIYYWVEKGTPIYVRNNRDFSLPGDPS